MSNMSSCNNQTGHVTCNVMGLGKPFSHLSQLIAHYNMLITEVNI